LARSVRSRGKLCERLASSVPLSNLAALAGIEPARPAKLLAKPLHPGNGLVTTLADELALELGEAAHHGQNKLALRCRG
jgi:hypothetical protein